MTAPPEDLPPPPPAGAIELATVLSIATRMEPELIRAVRLRLLPHLDVGAEADLWFCDWVGARTPEAIALIPECLPYLRAGLVAKLETEPQLREVMGIVTEFHRGLSPALLLEEQITWDTLSGDTDSATQHLNRALHALVRENRSGLAGWFAEASQRLPSQTLSTATAWSLANAARPHVPSLEPGVAPELTLTTVSSIASALGEAPLGVLRAGEALLLGKVGGTDAAAVLVPDTSPRVVEITAGTTVRTVRVDATEVVRVDVGTGPVSLRTGAGHVYVIDGPVPAAAPRPTMSPYEELTYLIGPEVDPELVPRLTQGIRDLLDWFRRYDEIAVLRQALTLAERALGAGYEPRDFPELGCEAAETLYLHGLRLGSRKSLERTVHVAQHLTGAPDVKLRLRARALVGAAQRQIFCHTGDLSQLHRSVDTLETWVNQLLGGSVPIGRLVAELLDTYLLLHEVQPRRGSLRQALDLVSTAFESAADREAVALPLARALVARYEAEGDPVDLDEAEYWTANRGSREEPRSVQAEWAALLSSVHMARFWRDGSQEALDAALMHCRSAVRICPGSDKLLRARLRHALSDVLRVRAAVLSEHADLDEAVDLAERAAKALPRGSVWRLEALLGLNRCLLDSFRRTGAVSTLDRAIGTSRDFRIDVRHDLDLPYRHAALVQQGECLVLRYKATGDSASLGQALESFRATRGRNLAQDDGRSAAYASALLELHTLDPSSAEVASALEELHSLLIHDDLDPPFTDPESASVVLAQAAYVSLSPHQSRVSLRRAADKARYIATDPGAPPMQRLRAGLIWGNLATRLSQSEDVVRSYETVAPLVPLMLLASGREHADIVRVWEKLSREVAAHAIEVGAPERALEYLEQRNVLLAAWRQGSDAGVGRLRESAPELVAELRRLWAFLHLAPQSPAVRIHQRQGLAPARLDQLVVAVHAVPGFEEFLAPVPFDRLVAAASEGPVVVLNAAARRCDALLVTRQGMAVLPLPGVSLVQLSDHSAGYRFAMGHDGSPVDEPRAWSVLGWLSERVVAPVLSALGMTVPLDRGSDPLPRMWWCPTDPFAVLPLHLAGQRRSAMDYAVHSYTSSLQALTAARHRERHAVREPVRPMLLVLAEDGLPHGRREIGELLQRFPHAQVLLGEQATGATVAAQLGEHPFLHYVGRAGLHGGVPQLRFGADGTGDQPLLGLRPVVDGALAYLSVRESEGSDLILESDGWALATCFQAAGFDHVIGSPVWCADRDAEALARALYDWLLTSDGQLHPERSAHALHHVVRKAIAESSEHALTYAAVVHLGP